MELKHALERKKTDPQIPYKPHAWRRYLEMFALISQYPTLPRDLEEGFDVGIPTITATFTPPNRASVIELSNEFDSNIRTEFDRGRYLGPATRADVEALIGPFQTSPLSVIPKPAKPGKYRLIQNLSFPLTPKDGIPSINSHIDSSRHPCTWGSFSVICLLIARLPHGSQAAVRDVKEAYRTIPVKPSQWPGLVVRLQGEDQFAIDTRNCFGLASSAGCYGVVGDAGAQIMRACGIGPLSKWVDDHFFCRILKTHLQSYNKLRRQWAQDIEQNGGQKHDGGRLWFQGQLMPNGQPEEFDEDANFPLRDLSNSSPRSKEDQKYTYCMADVDNISNQLGIPWETEKDVPFQSTVPFIGLLWDLENRTVSIPGPKREKYLAAIFEWERHATHNLEEVQKLYGKLLHTCLVIPEGRAYLTNLETFMAIFHNSPFLPRHPPKFTAEDLRWWKSKLRNVSILRPIPTPTPIIDLLAYSDASSEIGIGITIGKGWRAWRLLPGWKGDGRDIGWAEAVGFLLLIITLQHGFCRSGTHLAVYGDNRGVVEGWWKGRSRNWATNSIFRRVHDLTSNTDTTIHTRYVASAENPADGPSRGEYGTAENLLPLIKIPGNLGSYVVDFDAPLTPAEFRLTKENRTPTPAPKISVADRKQLHTISSEIQAIREDEDLARFSQARFHE